MPNMQAFQNQPCETFFVEEDGFERRPPLYVRLNGGRLWQKWATDRLNQQICDTYMADMIQHMKEVENNTLADVASIDIQQEIQWFMRPYLIDFLIEAHAAFQLLPETLFLAVNLLDRYCSKRVVYKRHYQLVGCAALLIAAKYGDRKDRVPMIKELKTMCCSLYEDDMFLQMEWHVLNTLDWSIGHPTVDTWMQISLKDYPDDPELAHMALYLSEMALYHKEFVQVRSSELAAAALNLAKAILNRQNPVYDEYDSTHILYLSQILDKPSQVLARKYAAPRLSQVSVCVDNLMQKIEFGPASQVHPPTPPCDAGMKSAPTSDMFPGTPQKPYGNVVNGYMTPPITPEGEYFVNGNEIKGGQPAPRCPVTPTPTHQPYTAKQHYAEWVSRH